MSHPFFTYHGPISIDEILRLLKIKINTRNDFNITDIKDLSNADQNSLTFLHSNKYKDMAKFTKASYCITTEKFKSYLPENCKAIISDNVLLHTSKLTKILQITNKS